MLALPPTARTSALTSILLAASACAPEVPPGPQGMVWVPGGTFTMGNDLGLLDQRPARTVRVAGFWMDRTEVTNAEFARFVAATGYRTLAERQGDGVVFTPPREGPVDLRDFTRWWSVVRGAQWRHPHGPDSSIVGLENHPVVQVAFEDALAFAKWAGKRLPSEAEWEFAARGGITDPQLVCGLPLEAQGRFRANVFQGTFPTTNTALDGFLRTAPVASYPANAYGLHDLAGNVWEWCSDLYHVRAYERATGDAPPNPDVCYDPDEPGLEKRVVRGGSYLCSDVYCRGYEPGARMKTAIDTMLCHTGFRCVRS